MYSTVGRYISQGVYTVAGPFHPFGGAVDIIVVQQEDGTFKSSPWYVKFGKFQGVLKQREKVVDVAVNGNDVNFHMFLDTTGGAYFLKDADLENEASILSPPSAASSGDDTVVNTLATQAANADDDDVQAKVEIQESKEVAENSSSSDKKTEDLELRSEGRNTSSILVQEVPASQGEALSETVVAPLQENGVASHTRLAGEGCTPDEIASRDVCRITNGQSDNEQESDEVISTARVSTRYGNTAEGEMAIHALLNHAIGLDQCCNSGPAASLFANATLAALEKAASSVQTPTTLEGLSQNRVLEESCTESSASLFDKDTNPLRNSNLEKGVHFVRDVKGSSLQGSNSLDSRLVAALPKLEFLRQGSEYALNFPQGITIASADGGVFLEATYPDDLGFLRSEDARQQYQGPSETNLTVSVPQQNDTCEPLESFDTRPQGPDSLVGADHEVSEEDEEKIDWSVATTISNEAEVVDHGSESGHKEHSRAEKEKQEIDCAHHDVVFKSLSVENGEMMQGAGEESLECKLLPSVAEQEALQVEVAEAEVQYPAPSNRVVGDQFFGLQDNISEDVQINSMIQPDLEDTRTLDVRDGSTQCKEGPEIAHVCATEPVVSLPSEENPTSSTHEGDPSPGVEAAIVQERAWRDATDKAAAVLRASPLSAKAHQHKTGLDRKTKTGGALRSMPKGYNQSLPSNSTPAVLDKNMQLTKPAQKKTDVLEQSDRKPWLWWGWRGTPSLPKQRSDQDEKKETKEVKATTNQAGEDSTQASLNAPKVNSQSLGIVDDQNSSMREGDKMLRENDAQESNGEEAVVSSTGKSSTVVKRTKESSTEHKTKGEGSEVEEKEEKGELLTEVVSSNTTQNSEGKEAENPARRSILGLLFRGYGKEQTLASPDSALERESSLERAEIISDLLDNSWGYGSGVKSRKSPQKLNSQEPLVISSLNSQTVATAKDSQAKASDSQMSLTGQTMGPEELVINERSDVPFNNDSTLDSSLHLQAGGGCSTEAAEDSGIPRLSQPSFNHADCTTTAHCPSSVSINIAAGGKGPDIVRDEDTSQDSGEIVLQGGRSNAADSDNGSIVSDSNMNRKEKLAGVSLAATTCAVLMDDMEGASSMVSMSPDRLQDEEVNEDVNSLAISSQELTSLHECAKRVSFPVAMDSMTVRTKLQEQEVVGENTFLVKYPAVLQVEELVGADKEQSSTPVTEVMPVSCAGLDVMALTDPVNACSSIEDSTSCSPVLSLDEEKPSNKGDDSVENSDLQEGVSEEKVPPLSPVRDEIMAGGAGASSSKLLSRNLAVLETSPTWDGASHTQTYVVEVTQTMPVTTKVLEIVRAGEALADTGEMGEVASTLHAGNSSEGELENPLSYSDAGAANRKSTYVEANTSEEQEEEVHRKLAVMKIDHVASAPCGENMSDDELENPLSYSHIGSASGKSIYFEANTSEEEEEEGNREVVDADKDLEMLRRKSDPIGIPVSLENSALDDLFVIAKDRPLSESLPDVRLQSADAAISGIWSALSRSVGSEPLPHTKRSSSRRDSSSYVMSPAEGTHEQVDGFPQNIFEKGVGSPAGSGRSGDEDSAEADGMETAAETGVELSLCRHLLKDHMGREEAAEAFNSARVSLHEFKSSAASIIANDKLIIHVGGQYYPWSVAAPVVLGIFAFGQFIMPAIEGAIQVERPEPVAKSQAVVRTLGPTTSGGWKLWPFPSRRQKTPEQSITANPSVPRDSLKGAAGTALQTSFANDLLRQEGYYEHPRKSKVQTIIPTSQMLAQMNLKEGSNRITFTFFTRMLGKQQLDARVYLWKWNTRIVISDVDGTITKSDVLGQVMPLVGKDWTQSGVARLFSSIKENGYELLFLSARAISQADLTRQFLFNVKQDGETLPNGPVVISPDGLFPSLYREVIRRTPHEFKIACLQDIRSLFPQDCNPFYAGFGNRDTDEISYLKVGIPKGKIFIINPRGEVAVNNRVDVKTYTSLHKLVNDMFPAQTYTAQEDYNSWNFWKLPLPDIEDELKRFTTAPIDLSKLTQHFFHQMNYYCLIILVKPKQQGGHC